MIKNRWLHWFRGGFFHLPGSSVFHKATYGSELLLYVPITRDPDWFDDVGISAPNAKKECCDSETKTLLVFADVAVSTKTWLCEDGDD